MTKHRQDPAQNPLLLLGAFVLVAGLLFAGFKALGPGTGDGAVTVSDTPTSAPTSVAEDPARTPARATKKDPHADRQRGLADLTSRIQPGQTLRPEPKPKPEPVVQVSRSGRSGTGLVLGVLPEGIDAPVGDPVSGQVTSSVANLPPMGSTSGFTGSIRTLTSGGSDFVFLNEIAHKSMDTILAGAPGYEGYRDPVIDQSAGGNGQSINNAVLWRADRWALLDGGRVKVVNDDRGFLGGKPFVWDRYAIWATLQRTDGAVMSVISLHMPTNPAKYPRQHGAASGSRVGQYAHGMDIVRALVGRLSAHGPVLLGGDMNSHPTQGSWTAAAKMGAGGYSYAKDQGVMYLFYPSAASLVSNQQVRVASDHPAIITTVDMGGLGPS